MYFFCEIFLKPEAGANQFDIDGRLVEYAIYTIYINVYICWSIRAAAAQGVLRVLSLSLSDRLDRFIALARPCLTFAFKCRVALIVCFKCRSSLAKLVKIEKLETGCGKPDAQTTNWIWKETKETGTGNGTERL